MFFVAPGNGAGFLHRAAHGAAVIGAIQQEGLEQRRVPRDGARSQARGVGPLRQAREDHQVPVVGAPERPRRLDELHLAQGEHLPAHKACGAHPAEGHEDDDDGHQAGTAEFGDDARADDDHEEAGNGKEDVDDAHQEAFNILEANRAVLDELVVVLLEKETILKDEIEEVFKNVRPVKPRPAWTGSDSRKPSNLPPVAIPSADAKPKKRAVRKKAE